MSCKHEAPTTQVLLHPARSARSARRASLRSFPKAFVRATGSQLPRARRPELQAHGKEPQGTFKAFQNIQSTRPQALPILRPSRTPTSPASHFPSRWRRRRRPRRHAETPPPLEALEAWWVWQGACWAQLAWSAESAPSASACVPLTGSRCLPFASSWLTSQKAAMLGTAPGWQNGPFRVLTLFERKHERN